MPHHLGLELHPSGTLAIVIPCSIFRTSDFAPIDKVLLVAAVRYNSRENASAFLSKASSELLSPRVMSVKSCLPQSLVLFWIYLGRGDREQEVVELNSKCLCGLNDTKIKKV